MPQDKVLALPDATIAIYREEDDGYGGINLVTLFEFLYVQDLRITKATTTRRESKYGVDADKVKATKGRYHLSIGCLFRSIDRAYEQASNEKESYRVVIDYAEKENPGQYERKTCTGCANTLWEETGRDPDILIERVAYDFATLIPETDADY